jgi:hypothetical protein
VTLREPPAGRYAAMVTRTAASPTATLTVDAFRGATREATRAFTSNLNVADIVRTGFTYAAATPQTISAFDAPEVVTSACSALSSGRVFAGGAVQERSAELRAFAETNKSQPIAFVVTDADLAAASAASVPSDLPAQVTDVRAVIDSAGVHLSGSVHASVLRLNAASDISVGSVDGKLTMRTRRLSADPLPAGLLDGVRAAVDRALGEFGGAFPFTVRQVSLRQGCLSIMGTTPP